MIFLAVIIESVWAIYLFLLPLVEWYRAQSRLYLPDRDIKIKNLGESPDLKSYGELASSKHCILLTMSSKAYKEGSNIRFCQEDVNMTSEGRGFSDMASSFFELYAYQLSTPSTKSFDSQYNSKYAPIRQNMKLIRVAACCGCWTTTSGYVRMIRARVITDERHLLTKCLANSHYLARLWVWMSFIKLRKIITKSL